MHQEKPREAFKSPIVLWSAENVEVCVGGAGAGSQLALMVDFTTAIKHIRALIVGTMALSSASSREPGDLFSLIMPATLQNRIFNQCNSSARWIIQNSAKASAISEHL